MKSIPAYTIAGITRPELFLDFDGNIILTPAALAFADQYGLKALYLGCPPGTPFPPVPGFIMTTPVDTNTADNIVAENARPMRRWVSRPRPMTSSTSRSPIR